MSAAPMSPLPIYERTDGADVRGLPIGPEEVFVLSLVDGTHDAGELAAASGLDPARVREHLGRLETLGAIRVTQSTRLTRPARASSAASRGPQHGGSLPPSGAPQRRTTPASDGAPRGSVPTAAPRAAAATPLFTASPLSGEIDATLSLSVELQARILELSARLSDLDHFQVLGVPMSADRAQIKRAYFSMIGTFHPDTYFGKQLGSFTKRMERIFQRLTEAHDVLSNPQARQEYEAYLRVLGRTRALEEVADRPPPGVEEIEQLLLQAEQAALGASAPTAPPSPPPPARPARVPPPMPPRAPSLLPPIERVDDPAARRAALARKFGRSRPVPQAPEPVESVSAQAARRSAAVKDLHQRYKHRQESILGQRLERFASAAEAALATGNTLSALNTLKIARSLAGSDPQIVARLDEIERKLGSSVADSYLERARYEESNGHYEQAARSYTRAARSLPSADVLRSAAECHLKAGLDLRQAGELAREAVQLAPNRADLRLSLAKIYESAGMQQSALGELERALELTPDSDRIKQWLKRLKRGGV